MTYVLAPAALSDLREIARYTRRQWGRKQGEKYRTQLELCFEMLASGKSRARPYNDVAPGLIVLRCQHHYIVGRIRDGSTATIFAVLHERMDLMARIAERLG